MRSSAGKESDHERQDHFRQISFSCMHDDHAGFRMRGDDPYSGLLHAEAVDGRKETTSTQDGVKDLVVGVGPVSWPEYLDRPQLITRESPIRVRVNEFHRWAGRPQEDFLRVLTQNISLLLGSDKVVSHPWGDYFGVGYKVPLDVQQFDGSPGEAVLLNVRWAVLGRDDKPLVIRKSVISAEVKGTDYDALVLAESQALVELSKEIAAEIRKLVATR